MRGGLKGRGNTDAQERAQVRERGKIIETLTETASKEGERKVRVELCVCVGGQLPHWEQTFPLS